MLKLNHIGYVISPIKLNIYKKKYVFIKDDVQKNYIFFKFSKKLKVWLEYIIPFANESTVYNYSSKNKNNPHHYGFLTHDMSAKKKLINNGFILIGNYRINVPCFGGIIKTSFFCNKNYLVEILSNEGK